MNSLETELLAELLAELKVLEADLLQLEECICKDCRFKKENLELKAEKLQKELNCIAHIRFLVTESCEKNKLELNNC